MLGAEGAARQGISAPPPSVGSDRTTQTRANEPPQRNRRLREGQRAFLSSPDLGCPQSLPVLLEFWTGWGRKSRSVRRWLGAGIGRMQLATCIHQQAPGDSELWVLLPSRGVNSYEGSPRSLFARRRSSGLRASWGSAPDFAGLPVRRRHGQPRRRRSRCCSTKWSADSQKRCSAPRISQRRPKTAS
jgi:hypothetical protein